MRKSLDVFLCRFVIVGSFAMYRTVIGQACNPTVPSCPQGQYCAAHGRCLKCPIGKFTSSSRAPRCKSCPLGRTTMSEATVAISSMAACTVAVDFEGAKCKLGMSVYRVLTGFACRACPSGKHGSQGGTCSYCAPGYYRMNRNATPAGVSVSCERCPRGKYAAAKGATLCQICSCPAGQFPLGRDTARCKCRWCPSGKYKPAAGGVPCLQCDCGAGRYRQHSQVLPEPGAKGSAALVGAEAGVLCESFAHNAA